MEWKSVGIIISNIWTKTCSKPPTSYDMSNKKTHVTTLESQGLLRCYHTLEKIWHMNTYDKIHRNHQVIAFSFAGAGFWMDFATILCESEQLEPKFLWKTWPSCPLTWPWLGPDLAILASQILLGNVPLTSAWNSVWNSKNWRDISGKMNGLAACNPT